jgi:uncharacterized protein YkwD
MQHVLRLMRVPILLVVLLAATGLGTSWQSFGTPAYAAIAVTTEGQCLDTQEKAFLTLVNNYRASKGLAALKASKALNVAAHFHSKDMGTRKYFSHTTKTPLPAGLTGSSPWDRMRDAGYGYNTSKGENIAAGYATAQKVFNAWKASSGHNANMLNAKFKVIGIGLATVSGSPYTNYWTTDFGGVVDAAATC